MLRYRTKSVFTLLVVLLLLAALFAGCNGESAPGAASSGLLTVRHRATGQTVSIGATREEAESVLGLRSGGWDFTEENAVGDFYEDTMPGIRVDYVDDVVVRLLIFSDAWDLLNGLYPGMPRDDALALYADVDVKEEGESGGTFISYDENLVPVAYNEFSPYILEIGYTEEDTVLHAYVVSTF